MHANSFVCRVYTRSGGNQPYNQLSVRYNELQDGPYLHLVIPVDHSAITFERNLPGFPF